MTTKTNAIDTNTSPGSITVTVNLTGALDLGAHTRLREILTRPGSWFLSPLRQLARDAGGAPVELVVPEYPFTLAKKQLSAEIAKLAASRAAFDEIDSPLKLIEDRASKANDVKMIVALLGEVQTQANRAVNMERRFGATG